jgi:hypothetical protein
MKEISLLNDHDDDDYDDNYEFNFILFSFLNHHRYI